MMMAEKEAVRSPRTTTTGQMILMTAAVVPTASRPPGLQECKGESHGRRPFVRVQSEPSMWLSVETAATRPYLVLPCRGVRSLDIHQHQSIAAPPRKLLVLVSSSLFGLQKGSGNALNNIRSGFVMDKPSLLGVSGSVSTSESTRMRLAFHKNTVDDETCVKNASDSKATFVPTVEKGFKKSLRFNPTPGIGERSPPIVHWRPTHSRPSSTLQQRPIQVEPKSTEMTRHNKSPLSEPNAFGAIGRWSSNQS